MGRRAIGGIVDFSGELLTRRDVMMDEFDPNLPDRNEWATYIPRWRGSFHTHKTRGHALRAAHPRFAPSAVVYKRDFSTNGRWVEIHRHDAREEPPDACEMCGWTKPPSNPNSWRTWFPPLIRRWVRHAGRVVDPPRVAWMCEDCVTKQTKR